MRGAMYNGVNVDITLEEFETPVINDDEVLVRNVRSGICGTDLHAYLDEGDTVGICAGNTFGHEMVGKVVEVGKNVEGIEVGMRVFVNPTNIRDIPEGWNFTMNTDMAGAFSEYVKVQRPKLGYNLFQLADNVSYDEGALTEPISVAMHGVNISNPKPGEKAVIYGAGPIGLGALASLLSKGVKDVIVSDVVPARLKVVKEMGGIPFNAKEGDLMTFVKETWGTTIDRGGNEATNADIYLDCAGCKGIFDEYMGNAKFNARFVAIAIGNAADSFVPTIALIKELKIYGSAAYEAADNQEVVDMLAKKEVNVSPMITGKYPLSEATQAFKDACDKDRHVKVLLDMEN